MPDPLRSLVIGPVETATGKQSPATRGKRKHGSGCVWAHRHQWRTEIMVDGRRLGLGIFDRREDALAAVSAAGALPRDELLALAARVRAAPRRPHTNRTHGEGHDTPEYRTWRAMRDRCNNPNGTAWKDYGGRGIKVADEWNHPGGFPAFLAHVGRRPPGRSIDRIDNDGDYRPGNVRWATRSEQALNTRRSKANRGECAESAGGRAR